MAKTAKKAAPKKAAASKKAQSEQDPKLKELFVDELKDIYWAEKHLVKALPKMQKAASSKELQKAFTDHLAATKEHVSRLEQVFGLLGQKVQAKKCDAMSGLVEEAQGIIEDTEAGTSTRDVGLILAAQKVEHYEIATYGGLAQLASTLGHKEAAAVLGSTLQEEKDADELLSTIAYESVNYEAAKEV